MLAKLFENDLRTTYGNNLRMISNICGMNIDEWGSLYQGLNRAELKKGKKCMYNDKFQYNSLFRSILSQKNVCEYQHKLISL